MLIFFFNSLRKLGIPVSINELIDLIGALDKGLSFCNIDEFYFLSRSILVKDEKYFDRYDQCFHNFFSHIESQDNFFKALIPEDWLYEKFVKSFSDEEKKNIKSLGDFEKIIEEFKKRLANDNINAEFDESIKQVKKIANFRLEDVFNE